MTEISLCPGRGSRAIIHINIFVSKHRLVSRNTEKLHLCALGLIPFNSLLMSHYGFITTQHIYKCET